MLFSILKGGFKLFWFFVLIFNVFLFYADATKGQISFDRIGTTRSENISQPVGGLKTNAAGHSLNKVTGINFTVNPASQRSKSNGEASASVSVNLCA